MDEVTQHEHILTSLSTRRSTVTQGDLQKIWDYVKKPKPHNGGFKARAQAIEPQTRPPYPKDDATKSKDKNGKLRTPALLGKCPCRHCGSRQHWDSDCKYRKLNATQARTQFLSLTEEELLDEEDYEHAQVSENDQDDPNEELETTEEGAEQDF